MWVLRLSIESSRAGLFALPILRSLPSSSFRSRRAAGVGRRTRVVDIVTGITALAVAALVASGRGGRALVTAWNVLGLALLLNVVVVAILATPRVAYFGSERLNVWVTYLPFVWLPAVMVLAALAGHLVIFRALRLQRNQSTRIRR